MSQLACLRLVHAHRKDSPLSSAVPARSAPKASLDVSLASPYATIAYGVTALCACTGQADLRFDPVSPESGAGVCGSRRLRCEHSARSTPALGRRCAIRGAGAGPESAGTDAADCPRCGCRNGCSSLVLPVFVQPSGGGACRQAHPLLASSRERWSWQSRYLARVVRLNPARHCLPMDSGT